MKAIYGSVVLLLVCGCNVLQTSQGIHDAAEAAQPAVAAVGAVIPGAAPYATITEIVLGAVAAVAGAVVVHYRAKAKANG